MIHQDRKEAKKILITYKFGNEEEKANVLQLIAQVDDVRFRNLLTMRYINLFSWNKIIYEWMKLGYCESYTYQLHARALEAFMIVCRQTV